MTYWFFLLLSRNMCSTSGECFRGAREWAFCQAEKCAFHAQSVPFLGYIVSSEGVRMDPEKVKAVVEWPSPDSRKALQRFLGFANFYRRFIRNFSQLAAPLTALTSPRTTFRWSNTAEAVFTKLKGRFVSAPILIAPDSSRQFMVEYAHNALPVSSTGLSPFECSLGYQPPIFPSLESEVAVPSAHAFVQRCRRTWTRARETLLQVGARTKAKADRHRSKPPVYVVGQKVWLSTKEHSSPLRF